LKKNLMAFLACSMPNGDLMRLILVLGLQESQYRSLELEGRALSCHSCIDKFQNCALGLLANLK
jgi:hypothetical protein